MKRKKFWIVFSSCLLGLIGLCVIFAVVFRLKTVDVVIRSRKVPESTNLEAGIQQRVLETGEFDIGKNILFMNFDENIEKIEKSNPFVKVEQVIRHFPNNVRIYISEREPKYRVKDSSTLTENWYIMDEDFKILDKVTEGELTTKQVCGNSNYFDQTIEITKETLTLTSAIIGEFASDELSVHLAEIVRGVYGKTTDHTVVRMIDYNKTSDKFVITMRNVSYADAKGCKLVVNGKNGLYEKTLKGTVAFINGQEKNDEDRIENIPDEIIEVKVDATGKVYVVNPNGKTE